MCISAVLWVAFAKLVVPPIIESAYRGDSLPFLNKMIQGQHENPMSYYLEKWDSLTLHLLLTGLELWLFVLVLSSPTFLRVFRKSLRAATLASLGEGLPRSGEVVSDKSVSPLAAGYVFNLFSIFALFLICAPLTIGASWTFPIFDDGWLWLLLNENCAGLFAASQADRPVMAALWRLLATSEQAFWHSSFVAQAFFWPIFALIAALLWTQFFPNLRRYAMVVGCFTIAPIISKVQMVTATIVLASL